MTLEELARKVEERRRQGISNDDMHRSAKQRATQQIFRDRLDDLNAQMFGNAFAEQRRKQEILWGQQHAAPPRPSEDTSYICATAFVGSNGIAQVTELYQKHPSTMEYEPI